LLAVLGATCHVTTSTWNVGFACPKDTSVGFTDVVMRECESCKKEQPYFWPWMRIGITRSHSRKKNFAPIVTRTFPKVRKKQSGDVRSCELRVPRRDDRGCCEIWKNDTLPHPSLEAGG
jgi:hypothetical protein